jgi:hypothetical protein
METGMQRSIDRMFQNIHVCCITNTSNLVEYSLTIVDEIKIFNAKLLVYMSVASLYMCACLARGSMAF